jgi:prevent-host-death family protein
MQAITARDANQRFSHYLREVQSGASFQITKRGAVVAALSAQPASVHASEAATSPVQADLLLLIKKSPFYGQIDASLFNRAALYD